MGKGTNSIDNLVDTFRSEQNGEYFAGDVFS